MYMYLLRSSFCGLRLFSLAPQQTHRLDHIIYTIAEEGASASISSSIRLQSDSTPFSVFVSRQPCNISSPVAFALKTVLSKC